MNSSQLQTWLCKSKPSSLVFKKPLVMGILNVTSDSFSDGGLFLSREKACEQARLLLAQGADIIDIGGESTKPGAQEVPLEIELERVIPVIEGIRQFSDCAISIDTYKPEVMQAAVFAGANLINDVYALRREGALAMASKLSVPVCLMHMQNEPHNMQDKPHYPQGILAEIGSFFEERLKACSEAGIAEDKIILDPGFGFGKSIKDNLYLIKHFDYFKQFNKPLLLGVSRKSTIGAILDKETDKRLIGSISLTLYAALKGLSIIRTHDVEETKQALQMLEAVEATHDY